MENKPQIECTASQATDSGTYKNSTFVIISKVAYLIGVSLKIFNNEYEPPQKDYYYQLECNKNARIVRDLCQLRTMIKRNYRAIAEQMNHDYRSILSLPELVPMDCIQRLGEEGIMIVRSKQKLNDCIIEINRQISDRLNNCRELFPLWLDWAYLRNLFVMPNGFCEHGVREAMALYHDNMALYPYQVYINWLPEDEGNILYNDKKFVSLLYKWNNNEFIDFSKVSNVGDRVKGNIYDFLEMSERAVLVVDCENSDPYKLCAVLQNLEAYMRARITKIMLFDDVHAATAWRILESHTDILVEHILIERVKQNKSLVDIRLTAGTCKEFYQNNVDSFIIVSSDSDYWGLISAIPEARFLVMVERRKCSPMIKDALQRFGIYYCYIDDFYSGDNDQIKLTALVNEVYRYLGTAINLNINRMMDEVYRVTRADMSDAEKTQFYNKYIKAMHLLIGDDGEVSIKLNIK